MQRQQMGEKWSQHAFAEMFNGYFKNGERVAFKAVSEGKADPFEINLAVRRLFGHIVSNCSGFPDQPYLALPKEEREGWIKEFSLQQLRPDRPSMAQQSFFDVRLEPKKAMELYEAHIVEWARQHLNDKSDAAKKRSANTVDRGL